MVISVCLKRGFYPALFIVFKIEMHYGMDSVEQNGKKSMRKYTLVYQVMQAFNQLTRSHGIKLLSLKHVCHPVITSLPYIWTSSVSVCSTNACDIANSGVPLVHVESHIAEFWFILIITRYEI